MSGHGIYIRYRERTPGISGFSAASIPATQRWEAYVRGVGTRLFETEAAARSWAKEAKKAKLLSSRQET